MRACQSQRCGWILLPVGELAEALHKINPRTWRRAWGGREEGGGWGGKGVFTINRGSINVIFIQGEEKGGGVWEL